MTKQEYYGIEDKIAYTAKGCNIVSLEDGSYLLTEKQKEDYPSAVLAIVNLKLEANNTLLPNGTKAIHLGKSPMADEFIEKVKELSLKLAMTQNSPLSVTDKCRT